MQETNHSLFSYRFIGGCYDSFVEQFTFSAWPGLGVMTAANSIGAILSVRVGCNCSRINLSWWNDAWETILSPKLRVI
jgi:hypothetical protein